MGLPISDMSAVLISGCLVGWRLINWFQKLKRTYSITFHHSWTIKHFDVYCRGESEWKWALGSRTFSVLEDDYLKFRIEAELKEKKGRKWLAVGVITRSMPFWWEKKVQLWGRRWIENADGEMVQRKNYGDNELRINVASWDPEYISVSDLLDPNLKLLNDDGTLVLHIEIAISSNEPLFRSFTRCPPSHSLTNVLVPVVTFQHQFMLAHFSLLYHRDDCYRHAIQSSIYFALAIEEMGKFYIQVYPKGRSTEEDTKQVIIILIGNQNELDASVRMKLSVVKEGGGEFVIDHEFRKIPQKDEIEVPLSRSLLLDPTNGLLPGDMLKLNCELIVMADKQLETESPVGSIPFTGHFTKYKSYSIVDIASGQVHHAQTSWTIEQFKSKLVQSTDPQISSSFKSSTLLNYAFALHLYTKCDDEYVMIALWNAVEMSEETEVQYCIRIRGQETMRPIEGIATISAVDEYAKRPLLKRKDLINFSENLLPNDRLTIDCQLFICIPRQNYSVDQLYPANVKTTTSSTVTNINVSESSNMIIASSSNVKSDDINFSVTTTAASAGDRNGKPVGSKVNKAKSKKRK